MLLHANLIKFRGIELIRPPLFIIISLFVLSFLGCNSESFDDEHKLIPTLEFYFNHQGEYGYKPSRNVLLDKNGECLLYEKRKNSIIQISNTGKIDTLLSENHFDFFSILNNQIWLFNRNKIVRLNANRKDTFYFPPEYKEDFKAYNSSRQRPILLDDILFFRISLISNLSVEDYYSKALNRGWLGVIDTKKKNMSEIGFFPKSYPYEIPQRRFNGLEYSLTYTTIDNLLFVGYSLSSRINVYDLSNNDLLRTHDIKGSTLFSTLANNKADENWEQNDKQKYVAVTSMNSSLHSTKKGRLFLVFQKGLEFSEGYLSQLDRDVYLLELSPKTMEVIGHYKMDGYYSEVYSSGDYLLFRKKTENDKIFQLDAFLFD